MLHLAPHAAKFLLRNRSETRCINLPQLNRPLLIIIAHIGDQSEIIVSMQRSMCSNYHDSLAMFPRSQEAPRDAPPEA